MLGIRRRLHGILEAVLRGCLLLIAFLGAWWLRPSYPDPLQLPPEPYFLGFLITVPILLALLCWLLLGLRGLGAALRDSRRWWLLFWLLLAGWVLLSPTWAKYAQVAGNSAAQFAVVAAFGFLAACTPISARVVIGALAAGAAVQAVVIIAQMGIQDDLGLRWLGELNLYPERQGLSVLNAESLRLLRPYGLSVHPNVVGGYLALGVLGMAAWLFMPCSRWRWAVRALTFGVSLWALCLTFSRSAWLACLLALAAFSLWATRRALWQGQAVRRALAAVAFSLCILALFGIGYAPFLLARAGVGAESVEQISIAQRGIFIDFARQLIERYPIAGVGVGTFAWEARDLLVRSQYRGLLRAENVHSVPLLILSELGIVGFVLWSAAFVAWLRAVWLKARRAESVALAVGALALLLIGVVDFYPIGIFSVQCVWLVCMGAAVAEGS